ncbi:MAG: penicillin-binding protein 2, partial [Patescibacteria group bacterium]
MKNVNQIRTKVLTIAGCLLFAIVIVRLADLQLAKHSQYESVAEAQRKRASELLPHRGTIYVQEGKGGDIFPIASNKKAWIAYAVPRNMKDVRYTVDTLAPALTAFRDRQENRTKNSVEVTGQNLVDSIIPVVSPDVSPTPSITPEIVLSLEDRARVLASNLYDRFDQKTDPYEPFLKPYEVLDDEFLAFLQDKKLDGVILEEQEIRTYPEGSLAAHAVGYVGFDESKRIGRYGVEGFFNTLLQGDFGFLSGEKTAGGQFIGVVGSEFRPAEDGSDVMLTIDRVVQTFAEQELRTGVERYRAERGSILVMNPKTGAILAMATYPTFDPNSYYAVRDARVQTNPIVSDSFEPGSILKPAVMAAAIDSALVTPDSTFVDSGPINVSRFKINTFDGKHLGVQTMTQALEQSNNIGMVHVAQKLGAERMYDYLRRFGLGERTGVELEGETQTNLKEPQKWNEATLATTGFGQGIVVTPMQALDTINAIANGGVLTQPHIVQTIKSASGEEKETVPASIRQVISPKTAET